MSRSSNTSGRSSLSAGSTNSSACTHTCTGARAHTHTTRAHTCIDVSAPVCAFYTCRRLMHACLCQSVQARHPRGWSSSSSSAHLWRAQHGEAERLLVEHQVCQRRVIGCGPEEASTHIDTQHAHPHLGVRFVTSLPGTYAARRCMAKAHVLSGDACVRTGIMLVLYARTHQVEATMH